MIKRVLKVFVIILIVLGVLFWLGAALFKLMHYPYVFELRVASVVFVLLGVGVTWFGNRRK